MAGGNGLTATIILSPNVDAEHNRFCNVSVAVFARENLQIRLPSEKKGIDV
jgi:hypothetical protein